MKVILSRKGFDSGTGCCASPIIGKKMISLPIPGTNEAMEYQDISYDGLSLKKLVEDLVPDKKKASKRSAKANKPVHLDPWIDERIQYKGKRLNPNAFGPNASLSFLRNNNIMPGDLFLFFGWFREVELKNNKYCFCEDEKDKHIIWGYMQVGAILDPENHFTSLKHHPHYNNTPIIIPSKTLSCLNFDLPGSGVFDFNQRRVLTLADDSRRSFWDYKKHKILKHVPLCRIKA